MTATERNAYNHIRRGAARSRAELARVMNVSRPTASAAADALIAAGLLREGGKYRGEGGRYPTLLLPCAEAFSLIGVDLGGGDRMPGVRVNALGEVIGSGFAPPLQSASGAAEHVVGLWEQLDPDFSAVGIGLAVPEGCGIEENELLRSLRRQLLGKYIHFSGRLSAAALSEGFCGGAEPCRDYLLLSWEHTVEAVICIGGRPFSGAHSLAGALRHLPAAAPDGGQADFADALAGLATGGMSDAGLSALCASALRHALALLDPEAVVLAGRFSKCGEEFFQLLSRRLRDFNCRVAPAKFGEFSAARGAAMLTHCSI